MFLFLNIVVAARMHACYQKTWPKVATNGVLGE